MRIKKVIPRMAILGIVTVFLLSSWAPAGAQEKSDEVNNEPIPFGINNPFKHPDSDNGSEDCFNSKSALKLGPNPGRPSYVERHLSVNAIKNCLPNGVGYMENIIKDIGLNLISSHFTRRYCEDDCSNERNKALPYFGLEGKQHRTHEFATQLYINGFNNYFWAAIEPQSTKHFPGDLKIVDSDRYYPNSAAGFAEWQKWLTAMFDYLDAHILEDEKGKPIIIDEKKQTAADKLLYIQLGNESDGDYAKSLEEICRENNNNTPCTEQQIKETKRRPDNPKHYYWSAYAKLIEKSYEVIRTRANPNTKIAIGAIAGVIIDGFQRPVLEYLSGKIDEEGKCRGPIVEGKCQFAANWTTNNRRCAGTGCFDVYDYHDFSSHREFMEYKGRRACWPKRNCEDNQIEIIKTPATFKKLLADSRFTDKGLVIQQGGTYTGQDDKTSAKEYQTEDDQASYLVKRGVYLLSQGVEAAQSVTYLEHSCFHNTIHSWFTLMGLTYNGVPEKGSVPDCHTKEPKPVDFIKETCDGQLPCPDPGRDVKKLSWFSQKKLIEILKGSDWANITPVFEEGKDNVYAFKFTQDNKSVYVAWWDWGKEYPRQEAEVEGCKKIHAGNYGLMDECINNLDKDTLRKNITLNFDFPQGKIQVTQAVPNYTTGKEAEVAGYEHAFHSETKEVVDGKVELTLGKKPLYIETAVENADKPLNFTMTVKWGNVLGQVIDKSQTNFDGSISIPGVSLSSTVHHPQVKLKLVEAKSFEGSHRDRITSRANPVSWKSRSYGGWDGMKVAISAWPNEKVVIQTAQGAITKTVQELYDLKTPFIQDVGKGREIVLSDTPKIEEDLPFGSITASPNPCTMSPEQDVCSSSISWQTQNAPNACILMKESGKTFACGASGSQSAPWISGDGATFELHASNDLSSPVLASVLVKGKKQPRINITSPQPTGGEVWAWGETRPISWIASNLAPGGTISIELYAGPQLKQTLFTGIPNTKNSQEWIIPKIAYGNNYRVRIISVRSDGSTEMSAYSQLFKIKPSITVVSPNGGEKWEAGKPQTITWSFNAPANTFVSLKLTRAGLSPISLATGLRTSKGAYSFIMSQGITGESFKVQAELYLINTPTQHSLIASDESDGLFSIVPPVPPAITVVSPNGGEKWEAGKPQTITWSFNAPANTFVSLKLTRVGLSPISLATGLRTSKGAYSFIMSQGITGESFKVQAELYLINTPTQHSLIASDESDGLFSIVPPVPRA